MNTASRDVHLYLPLSETIAPSDAAAVAEAVRRAAASATPVYLIGGGTSLGYGVRPGRPGIGLSLAKLDKVVDHAARDLTITVEAGMTVARLQKILAGARQRLPVDVPRAEQATIGGVVAVGASGPRRYRWGTIRDYVLGLTAVDGTGTPFSTGGRVVKNAAGYNLCRLVTGSLGTLGVITQVTLMVRPAAEREAWMACEVADFGAAERLLEGMIRTETLPTAVEWLVGQEWAQDAAVRDCPAGGAGRLVVGFEGNEAEVRWMVDSMAGLWRRLGLTLPVVIDGSRGRSLTQRLTDFPSGGDDGSVVTNVTVRISLLPGAVVQTVKRLLRLVPEASLAVDAGDGVVVARIALDVDGVLPFLRDLLRPLVVRHGGTVVALGAPAGAGLDGSAVWGPPPAGFDAMRAIKRQFDPKNILNPGRFLFGG